jgi:hypothetical protein
MTLIDVERVAHEHWKEHNRVTRPNLSRLENGKIGEPPMRILCQLGYLYGVSLDELAALYNFPHFTRAQEKVS